VREEEEDACLQTAPQTNRRQDAEADPPHHILDPELDLIHEVCVEAREELKDEPEGQQREEKLEQDGMGDEVKYRILANIESRDEKEREGLSWSLEESDSRSVLSPLLFQISNLLRREIRESSSRVG
jgi:hypothetical protein